MVSSKGPGSGKKTKGAAWTVTESGAMMTTSAEFIKQTVAYLKDHRELVNITYKGYLSPKVVVVGYDNEKLQIDKPPDWPGNQSVINILFKGAGHLFHQLTLQVTAVTKDSIYTTFPNKLIQLQRRADFRVVAPRGSQATFKKNGSQYSGFAIIDVSASGALLASDRRAEFERGDVLTKVAFSFAEEEMLPPKYFTIKQAKVMRAFRDENHKNCYGIHFSLDRKDEDNLLKYVRQLELVQVRKAASGI